MLLLFIKKKKKIILSFQATKEKPTFALHSGEWNNEYFSKFAKLGDNAPEFGSSVFRSSWYQEGKFPGFLQLTTNSSQVWLEVNATPKAKK